MISIRPDTIWPSCSVAVKWLIGRTSIWIESWLKRHRHFVASNSFQLLHRQGFWLSFYHKNKMIKSSEKIVATTQNNTFTTTLQRERMIFWDNIGVGDNANLLVTISFIIPQGFIPGNIKIFTRGRFELRFGIRSRVDGPGLNWTVLTYVDGLLKWAVLESQGLKLLGRPSTLPHIMTVYFGPDSFTFAIMTCHQNRIHVCFPSPTPTLSFSEKMRTDVKISILSGVWDTFFLLGFGTLFWMF